MQKVTLKLHEGGNNDLFIQNLNRQFPTIKIKFPENKHCCYNILSFFFSTDYTLEINVPSELHPYVMAYLIQTVDTKLGINIVAINDKLISEYTNKINKIESENALEEQYEFIM